MTRDEFSSLKPGDLIYRDTGVEGCARFVAAVVHVNHDSQIVYMTISEIVDRGSIIRPHVGQQWFASFWNSEEFGLLKKPEITFYDVGIEPHVMGLSPESIDFDAGRDVI